MLPKFDYIKPVSTKEAVDFLSQHGKESKILAGGTDLLVLMRAGVVRPRYIVDIKGIRSLKMTEYDRVKGLSIGATVTLNEMLESRIVEKHYPLLCESACLNSDNEIRNRATVVGNICNALPGADSAPPLMVLDAVAILASSRGERRVHVRNFFTGIRKTVMSNDELLKKVEVPPLQANSGTAFLKVGRTTEDLALVNVAVRITVDDHNVCSDAEIAIGGGIGSTLVRSKKACALLDGKRPVNDLIAKVAFVSSEELVPRPGSYRGSPQYKKALAKILIRRALKLAITRAQGTCRVNGGVK